MRSFLCGLAAAWFLVGALVLPYAQPAGLADEFAFMILVGLALLSAALMDWQKIAAWVRRQPTDATSSPRGTWPDNVTPR